MYIKWKFRKSRTPVMGQLSKLVRDDVESQIESLTPDVLTNFHETIYEDLTSGHNQVFRTS